MRMWMCDPRIQCRQHLLGEWRELYTLSAILQRHGKIDGYIANDLLEPESTLIRWHELHNEMLRRGYNARDEELIFNISYLSDEIRQHKINREAALSELLNRCHMCKERYMMLLSGLDPTTGRTVQFVNYRDWS